MGAPARLPRENQPVPPSLPNNDKSNRPLNPDAKLVSPVNPSLSIHSSIKSSSQTPSSTPPCKQKHSQIPTTPTLTNPPTTAVLPSSPAQKRTNDPSAPKPAPSIRNSTQSAPTTAHNPPPSASSKPSPAKLLEKSSTHTVAKAALTASVNMPAPALKKEATMPITKQKPAPVTAVQPVAKAIPVVQQQLVKAHPVTTPPSSGPTRAPSQKVVTTDPPIKSDSSSAYITPAVAQPVVKSTPVNTARTTTKVESKAALSQPVSKGTSVPARQVVRAGPSVVRPGSVSVNQTAAANQPTMVARQVPVKTSTPVSGATSVRTSVQRAPATSPTANGMTIARSSVSVNPAVGKASTTGQAMTTAKRVQHQVVNTAGLTKGGTQNVVRVTGQSTSRVVKAVPRTPQPVEGRSTQPTLRVPGQPVRTTGQTVVRTGSQPTVRNVQPAARAGAQQVARAATATVAQTSRQPMARTVVQNTAKSVSHVTARMSPTAVHTKMSVPANSIRKVIPGAQSVVRRAAGQTAPTTAGTTIARSNVARATQPGASPTRSAPQPLAGQTAVTGTRPTVQTTARTTLATTQRAVTKPLARAIPQPTSNATVSQSVSRTAQPGARMVASGTRPTPASQTVARVGSVPMRTAAQTTGRPISQPVARAVPHTAGNVIMKPSGAVVSQSPARLAPTKVNNVARQVVAQTQPTQAATSAVHPGVVRAVQKTASHSRQVQVRNITGVTPTKHISQIQRHPTTLAQTQARSNIMTPVKQVTRTVTKPAMTQGARPVAHAMRVATPMKTPTPAGRVVGSSSSTPQGIQSTAGRTAGASIVRSTTLRKQGSAQSHNTVAAELKMSKTTSVKKPITATTSAQPVTPQKRPPLVPPEALAAAMAAAAAVEPTPPLQPRSRSAPIPVKPMVAATRIAKAPNADSLTPKNVMGSAPAHVSKAKTKASSVEDLTLTNAVQPATVGFVPAPGRVVYTAAEAAAVAKAAQAAKASTPARAGARTPAPTPTSTPVQEPSRIPEGMTFLPGEHVTIWNRVEKRKIAGNAAPLGKNVEKYLRAHPDCEVYVDQDEDRPGSRSNRKRPKYNYHTEQPNAGDHIAIWNRVERRKIAGNAAPLAKNLQSYLRKNPNCEVYDYQDSKGKPRYRPRGAERSPPSPPVEEPSQYEFLNSPLDAWRDLNSYVDNEMLYKTDYEQTAELLLTHGDDDDDVSPLILTGPLGVEEPHVMIDLDKFINNDEDEVCEPLGDLLEDNLVPLKGSLEIPNSI